MPELSSEAGVEELLPVPRQERQARARYAGQDCRTRKALYLNRDAG